MGHASVSSVDSETGEKQGRQNKPRSSGNADGQLRQPTAEAPGRDRGAHRGKADWLWLHRKQRGHGAQNTHFHSRSYGPQRKSLAHSPV